MDGGVGYTYFDEKTGHEFSVVTGLTYNLVNPSTGYQNGIDWHLDWAASQFLTKTLQVGVVGYVCNQLTPDRGCADILCPFESCTVGIGPQLGIIIPSTSIQTYLKCPLYPRKRTSITTAAMSALCQKRTHAVQQKQGETKSKSVGHACAFGRRGPYDPTAAR
jgi:hypothetical protein